MNGKLHDHVKILLTNFYLHCHRRTFNIPSKKVRLHRVSCSFHLQSGVNDFPSVSFTAGEKPECDEKKILFGMNFHYSNQSHQTIYFIFVVLSTDIFHCRFDKRNMLPSHVKRSKRKEKTPTLEYTG